MSDKTLFDAEIKTKMATYEVKPPEEIWLNISKQRSFGHITTNRIMQGFFLMGILAFIAGFGLYFSGWSNPVGNKYTPKIKTSIKETSKLPEQVHYLIEKKEEQNSIKSAESNLREVRSIPTQDLTASLQTAALYLDPAIFADQSLQRLLNRVEDISLIEPFELVRYERLSKMCPKPAVFDRMEASLERKDDWSYFPEFKKSKQIAIALSFTPEFINKDFELRDFLPAGYADGRKDYSRSRNAYTASARAVYRWGKHSFSETGIDYTSILEKTQMGSSLYSSRFSFYSIPILFGQEVQFNRISWRIKSGFSYQFHNAYQGTILAADGIKILDLNSAENPYRGSGVFNLHVSSGISYLYRENLNLYLEPYYKRSLNSLSKNASDFSEKIEYVGIAIGVSMEIE